MMMKLFENRTPGSYVVGSPITALVTRTKTEKGNVFWLIKTPLTTKAMYTDPNTFVLKEGKVSVVCKYANWKFESYNVPVDPNND